MIRITHQRNKCIGCNSCLEIAISRWKMSKKDGKSILLGANEKRGFYVAVVGDDEYPSIQKAANACPTKIIKVEKII